MTRDEIALLISETAPRYQSWGIEAHFQSFAARLLEIEREACALVADIVAREIDDTNGTATYIANAIRARGDA